MKKKIKKQSKNREDLYGIIIILIVMVVVLIIVIATQLNIEKDYREAIERAAEIDKVLEELEDEDFNEILIITGNHTTHRCLLLSQEFNKLKKLDQRKLVIGSMIQSCAIIEIETLNNSKVNYVLDKYHIRVVS